MPGGRGYWRSSLLAKVTFVLAIALISALINISHEKSWADAVFSTSEGTKAYDTSNAYEYDTVIPLKLTYDIWISSAYAYCENNFLVISLVASPSGKAYYQIKNAKSNPRLFCKLENEHSGHSIVPVGEYLFICRTQTTCVGKNTREKHLGVSIYGRHVAKVSKVKVTLIKRDIVPKYSISLVTTLRNPERYLKEWMHYHFRLGAEHIFLYDDCTEGDLYGYLEEYINANLVTLIDWCKFTNWTSFKFVAKNNFFVRYSFLSRYVIHLDIDCFFYAFEERRNSFKAIDFLSELDAIDSKYGEIIVGSHWFGPGGIKERTLNLTQTYYYRSNMSIYDRRAGLEDGQSWDSTLSIARTKYLIGGGGTTHNWKTRAPARIPGLRFEGESAFGIAFIHYKLLSLEENLAKIKTGCFTGCSAVKKWYEYDARMNVKDERMKVFFPSTEYRKWMNMSVNDIANFVQERSGRSKSGYPR